MGYPLADSGLAPWGQAAAIILLLYLFFLVIIGLVLTAALMFALAWLREKAELLKKARTNVNQMNRALVAAQQGEPLAPEVADNQFIQVAARIPAMTAGLPTRASAIEQNVERGSNRVVGAVIEFHARTEMVKGMARAFFLPGLTRPRRVATEGKMVELAPEPVAASQEKLPEPPIYEDEITMVQRMR